MTLNRRGGNVVELGRNVVELGGNVVELGRGERGGTRERERGGTREGTCFFGGNVVELGNVFEGGEAGARGLVNEVRCSSEDARNELAERASLAPRFWFRRFYIASSIPTDSPARDIAHIHHIALQETGGQEQLAEDLLSAGGEVGDTAAAIKNLQAAAELDKEYEAMTAGIDQKAKEEVVAAMTARRRQEESAVQEAAVKRREEIKEAKKTRAVTNRKVSAHNFPAYEMDVHADEEGGGWIIEPKTNGDSDPTSGE